MKKKIMYLILQLGLCSAIFFIAAVFVFSLRGRKEQSFTVPNLIHKNFLSVYNELQRLGLRVKISSREYRDLPTGLILSQSPVAGEITYRNESLTLIVNQPKPFLTMPDLLQTSLDNARALIQHLPANGRSYALKIASVGQLPTNKFPHNTIIAQFPPAGKLVDLEEEVYLLVALRRQKIEPAEDPASNKEELGAWVGQNLIVAAQYFHHKKIDYRIRRLTSPQDPKQSGQIYKITSSAKNAYVLLDVYYQPPEKRYHSGYEKIKIELAEQGSCLVKGIPLDPSLLGSRHSLSNSKQEGLVFATRKHEKDEEVDVLFYRQGAIRIEASCGEELIYEEEFYPKDLS